MTTIWGMRVTWDAISRKSASPPKDCVVCVCVCVRVCVCLISCELCVDTWCISVLLMNSATLCILVTFPFLWLHVFVRVCVCVVACVRACYITGEFTAREISLLVQLCFSNWKLQRRTFQFPSLSREQALLCVCVCVCVWLIVYFMCGLYACQLSTKMGGFKPIDVTQIGTLMCLRAAGKQ